MSVVIQPFEQNTPYPIICKNTDKFQIIKEKFYQHQTEYTDSDSENIFKLRNTTIVSSKTMEENNIEDGAKIDLVKEA